jgi:hypothetical protein
MATGMGWPSQQPGSSPLLILAANHRAAVGFPAAGLPANMVRVPSCILPLPLCVQTHCGAVVLIVLSWISSAVRPDSGALPFVSALVAALIA